MAIKNLTGYHKLGFAYMGFETIARLVMQTWKTADKIGEPETETIEVDKSKINYNLTADYAMYNYDKTEENCDDTFAVAVYNYVKTLDRYKGVDV